MGELTKEEFSIIYKEKFMPLLKVLEEEQKQLMNKGKFFLIATILFFIAVFNPISLVLILAYPAVFIAIVIIFVIVLYMKGPLVKGENSSMKKDVVAKILALYGNMYFSDNKDIISVQEIKDMGLFPKFKTKEDDDIVIGIHNGCNFAIDECTMSHNQIASKNKSSTVSDFKGFIVKIQMKKNFSGKTVVGLKDEIKPFKGSEEVMLEDVKFCSNLMVYSTDQIEARYILTTAFMEKLNVLGNNFTKRYIEKYTTANNRENGILGALSNFCLSQYMSDPTATKVSAAFYGGYAYLFVPCFDDLFELYQYIGLDIPSEEQCYNVYKDIALILSIIDYLRLNSVTGL